MSITLITIQSEISENIYGTKASWLSWLIKHNYKVPRAIGLSVCNDVSQILGTEEQIASLERLLTIFKKGEKYSVAVRSSATCEDSAVSSFAGHFDTYTGEFDIAEIIEHTSKVIRSLARFASAIDDCKMGVVIQELIDPEVSGVIFSSNVLNESKYECTISYSEGAGAKLVGGQVGKDLNAVLDNGAWSYSVDTNLIDQDQVESIIKIAKSIESELGVPVDLEWCIEKHTQQLYILQCRPVSTINRLPKKITPVRMSNALDFPKSAMFSRKVALRLRAEELEIPMSAAYLTTASNPQQKDFTKELRDIHPSISCSAVSVVLLQPSRMNGKVVRQFCDYSSLSTVLFDLMSATLAKFWNAVAILIEVYDFIYTGIIKRIGDNVVMDIGRGHFISKGTIPASTFVIDNSGNVIYRNLSTQDEIIRITGSSTIREKINSQECLFPDDSLLGQIVTQLAPCLDSDKLSLEFGVIKLENSGYVVYLIDSIEQAGQAESLDINTIQEGVISPGRIDGVLEYINTQELSHMSLDRHFHDNLEERAEENRRVIFVCEHPDIGLLDTISRYNATNIGFVFQEATILCHIAIVLRERGIPAIRIGEINNISIGQMASLDAITTGLNPRERLKYHE